ncbi:hypothetical protein PGTUg99_007867 [Puccinia graminis f. sp. tritici]|uniref:Uncharacterized protein n=1 Tax=Puccinia graminis f. sp. tritici TaxID=56615 RepID=A0A5B0MRC5_PUCGR|nr:hypothetical protein PGTUg99_007867 [Puccinia graminis f. sp. tritici]
MNQSSMLPPSGLQHPELGTAPPKRKRRTKAEMAEYRDDLMARQRDRNASAKRQRIKRKSLRVASGSQSQQAQPSTSQSQPAASRSSNSHNSQGGCPLFQYSDYGLVCTYLENPRNFTEIHGDGSRTHVGPKCITKGAAYKRFAIYMNDSSHSGLNLDGKLLRQRLVAYKKKFSDAKKKSNSTGEGTQEGDELRSYEDQLEEECPYYSRMDAIFGQKANYTPAGLFESEQGTSLYSQIRPEIDPSLDVAHASQEGNLDLELEPDDNNELPSLHEIFPTSSQETFSTGLVSSTRSVPHGTFTQGSASTTTSIHQPRRTMESILGDLQVNIAQEDAADFDDTNNVGVELPSTPALGSASRGRFVNLPSVDRSIPAPRRDITNQKSKPTVAGAFESSSERKFAYLDKHMSLEERRFNWEKEKYNKEKGASSNREEAKMKAAEKWINQGKSAVDVQILIDSLF